MAVTVVTGPQEPGARGSRLARWRGAAADARAPSGGGAPQHRGEAAPSTGLPAAAPRSPIGRSRGRRKENVRARAQRPARPAPSGRLPTTPSADAICFLSPGTPGLSRKRGATGRGRPERQPRESLPGGQAPVTSSHAVWPRVVEPGCVGRGVGTLRVRKATGRQGCGWLHAHTRPQCGSSRGPRRGRGGVSFPVSGLSLAGASRLCSVHGAVGECSGRAHVPTTDAWGHSRAALSATWRWEDLPPGVPCARAERDTCFSRVSSGGGAGREKGRSEAFASGMGRWPRGWDRMGSGLCASPGCTSLTLQ